jgi:hypothetical protein
LDGAGAHLVVRTWSDEFHALSAAKALMGSCPVYVRVFSFSTGMDGLF